jgi:asparagine synthase (glutamine-hydrolysing)
MAGIVGIEAQGKRKQVTQMLDKISHRGNAGSKVVEIYGTTLGAVWPESQHVPSLPTLNRQAAWDAAYPPIPDQNQISKSWEHFSLAAVTPQGLFLARDNLGVRPLYYGYLDNHTLCFASEVKALLGVVSEIQEFPPGTWYRKQKGMHQYFRLDRGKLFTNEVSDIAAGLRLRLEQAVARRIDQGDIGCWLSGGLDSSIITSLVQPLVDDLHTFAAGLEGAEDLYYARQVADFLKTNHHEVVVTMPELLKALPDVIYHLESFDALLVRSTLTNYLVAKRASNYVGAVFSGEGGDELFAGYDYLKNLPTEKLEDELIDITRRLHNTALQRVDRSATASGLAVHIPFLDPDVVEYAQRIPSNLKLQRNGKLVEKWILRKALEDVLPENVLWRPKAKFWQGSGLGELMAQYAEQKISDQDFMQQRNLDGGWTLNTKEELMYYRVFKEHFGDLTDLTWMGRTKGAPIK